MTLTESKASIATPVDAGYAVDTSAITSIAVPEQANDAGKSNPSVAVPAPSDMEGGYTFDAVHEGRVIKVTVPEGGVKQGQLILVNVEEAEPVLKGVALGDRGNGDGNGDDSQHRLTDGTPIPTGKFRDELCDCGNRGCCEPQCCLAFWCHGILLAQVMTRLRMNAGAQVQMSPQKKTFAIVAAIWALYVILDTVRSSVGFETVTICENYYGSCYEVSRLKRTPFVNILSLVISVLALYFIVIGTMTRMGMRKQFNIKGSCLGDCCASFWCSCCSATQMARHTHDPNAYPIGCCTPNGLREGTPEIV